MNQKNILQQAKSSEQRSSSILPARSSLKRKGFCIQYFFSGATQNSGILNDNECQSDFIYNEKSHKKFLTKKQLLVYHEHRQKNENQ